MWAGASKGATPWAPPGGWKRPRLAGPGGTRARWHGTEGLVPGSGSAARAPASEPLSTGCFPGSTARDELSAPAGRPCAAPGDGSPGNCPRGRERAKPDLHHVHSSSVCESQRLEGTQCLTLWGRQPGLADTHCSGPGSRTLRDLRACDDLGRGLCPQRERREQIVGRSESEPHLRLGLDNAWARTPSLGNARHRDPRASVGFFNNTDFCIKHKMWYLTSYKCTIK